MIFLVFNIIGMCYINSQTRKENIYKNNIWYLHWLKVYFILFDSIINSKFNNSNIIATTTGNR